MSALPGVRAAVVLVGLLAAFALPGPAAAQRSAVGAALLRFEAALSWNAVSDDWRGIRPRWVQAAASTTSVDDLAELLLELEGNMGWNSVSLEWRGRRPGLGPGSQRPKQRG